MPEPGTQPEAASAPPPSERRTLWYTGWVQGVGFRFTVQGIAQGFAVQGYVRNLADGRVELAVEGRPGELDRFLAAVELAMARHIRSIDARNSTATGEFPDFSVRR